MILTIRIRGHTETTNVDSGEEFDIEVATGDGCAPVGNKITVRVDAVDGVIVVGAVLPGAPEGSAGAPEGSEVMRVTALRGMTGLGLMECKLLLKEAGGDISKA